MATYGQYHVVEKIAVGGMAEIYRGVSRGVGGFESPVVIKKVLSRFSNDKRFAQMLIREAKITARLDHEHIVKILDLGQNDEGEYFIVMEYVDGRNLRQIIDRTQRKKYTLTLDTILYILPPICDAVSHVHELKDAKGDSMRLIHRDISPSNILLSHTGEVKLTDFGVARFGEEPSVVASLKGELAYMSPEQARGETLDHRSDVFSLGAILFELVLGRRLFAGQNDVDTLESVRRAEIPRPSSIDPIISVRMEQILLKALAPKRSARYQSAAALSQELRSYRLDSCSARMGAPELSSWLARLFTGEVPDGDVASEVDFTLNTVAAFHESTPSGDIAQVLQVPQPNAAGASPKAIAPAPPSVHLEDDADDDDWANSTIPGEPAEELLRQTAAHGTQKLGSPMRAAETADAADTIERPISSTQPLTSPETVTKSMSGASGHGTKPYARVPLPAEKITTPTNRLEAITTIPSDAFELDEETAITDISDLPFDLSELRGGAAKGKPTARFPSNVATAVLDEEALQPPPAARRAPTPPSRQGQRPNVMSANLAGSSLGPVLGRRLAANEVAPDTAFEDEPTDGTPTGLASALSPEPVTVIGDPHDEMGLDDEGPTSLQPRFDPPPRRDARPRQLGSIEAESMRRTWLGDEAGVAPPKGPDQRDQLKTLAPVAISDEIEFIRALGDQRTPDPEFLPGGGGESSEPQLAPTPVFERPFEPSIGFHSSAQPPKRPELQVVEYHSGDEAPRMWPTKPNLHDEADFGGMTQPVSDPSSGGSSRFRRILPWLLVGLLGPPLGGVIGWLGIHFLSDARQVGSTVDQGLALLASEAGIDQAVVAQLSPVDASVAIVDSAVAAKAVAVDSAVPLATRSTGPAKTSAPPDEGKHAALSRQPKAKNGDGNKAGSAGRKPKERARRPVRKRQKPREPVRKKPPRDKPEKVAVIAKTKPAPAASAAKGQLIIKSDPWAQVHINGRNTNRTTSATPFSVPAGKITVELINPALNLRKKITLEIAPGQTVKKFVSLK